MSRLMSVAFTEQAVVERLADVERLGDIDATGLLQQSFEELAAVDGLPSLRSGIARRVVEVREVAERRPRGGLGVASLVDPAVHPQP